MKGDKVGAEYLMVIDLIVGGNNKIAGSENTSNGELMLA